MKLAIYDFDGTYLNTQTVPFLFKLWKSLGINDVAHKTHWGTITRWYILHKLKLKWDKETFRKHAMAKTIDLLHSVDDKTLSSFLETFYIHAQSLINKDLKDILQKDKQEGYHTVLLSGSFDCMLRPFLKEGFDDIIGTESVKNGIRLSSKEVDIIINDKKRDVIILKYPAINTTASKAYADSYYDVSVLSLVGNPIAYHPDTKLLAHAKTNHWEIIYETKN